ncbi:MAG: type II toxin-antitoxin system RelE/ParE family toxin [Acetobacteraceae bacterium]|nr:type II toxin-antitoxin system RelE/ParE family toxin [Acetobacteraceae bacterium]
MSGPAVLAPRAEQELYEALRYVGRENPAAARRLRDQVEAASKRIGARPLIGRLEPSLARPQYRFWSLTAFSLLLVYDAEADPVEILRIVHTARDLPKALKHLSS